ncbi:hypothetical protein CI109_101149 [Kwoniella shandongensis]|uniref:Uncharacterized protein n=1 Tax=Kwoniella shandongensis TaxID=1734106 RepID=A0A5M6C5Z7_9TREE|nr:uncharacterized protein CI109_001618 [Kwoniella shandongensis]KAA5530211.1 hypothetical protein CI109_001618 [Kwoniella shandongensis]
MSLIRSRLLSLPAPSITLALGGIGTAYVFFANIAEAQRGIIPLLNGRFGKLELGEKERVMLWNSYFDSAAKWIVSTSVLNSLLSFTTSYLHPSPNIRRLALLSGIFSISIVPTTFLVGLLPINSRLKELTKAGVEVRRSEGRELVQGWEKRHALRIPLYAIAWGLNLVAVLLDGRV